MRRNCEVLLLVSSKEVDQQATSSVRGARVATLPAVGLSGGNLPGFGAAFLRSYFVARKLFRQQRPQAVLAMGGFTSAPPILAGKSAGARTFLHESNAVPGRANRLLANFVDAAFVYFHEASGRLNLQKISVTGMPVRAPFLESMEAGAARMTLGLAADAPVLLIMGGSQGAGGINRMALECLPDWARQFPTLQYIHLTGARDFEQVRDFYATRKLRAVVRPFLTEAEFALGAATVAVSRAGASSLAELAAMRVPAVLVPYPHAVDDHQHANARWFVRLGAAALSPESAGGPALGAAVAKLLADPAERAAMQSALARWSFPDAAEKIAAAIVSWLPAGLPERAGGWGMHLPGVTLS